MSQRECVRDVRTIRLSRAGGGLMALMKRGRLCGNRTEEEEEEEKEK